MDLVHTKGPFTLANISLLGSAWVLATAFALGKLGVGLSTAHITLYAILEVSKPWAVQGL